MSTKQTYIRCPRCELNYILKKDKYCSVCKAEMQVGGGELDDAEMELCPICKTNYIGADEVMCPSCMQERNFNPDSDESVEDWEAYVNRDENDDFVSQTTKKKAILTMMTILIKIHIPTTMMTSMNLTMMTLMTMMMILTTMTTTMTSQKEKRKNKFKNHINCQ